MKKIITILVILLATNKLIAQNYKFGKISKKELEEKFYPQDSSANAVILYKNRRTYFDYVMGNGFMVVTEIHERIKIYNSEGYKWATKRIPYYNPKSSKSDKINIQSASTFLLVKDKIESHKLKKSELFDERINKYWSEEKFTMPNLTDGCIVEWKYRVISTYGRINKVQLQYGIPVKKILCSIEVPEYYQFSVKHKGFVQINSVQSTKYSKLVLTQKNRPFIVAPTSFKATDIDYRINVTKIDNSFVPALLEEPYVNNIDNYKSAIYFELSSVNLPRKPIKYYSRTWDDVTKTILSESEFGGELNKSSYFKDDLTHILNNSENREQLLIKIFEFVKHKVKWNQTKGIFRDKGVKKAYLDRSGSVADINFILISMLKKAGINANPLILSTRNHGIPVFPTIDGFNYVIAAVELKNEVYLLDATEIYNVPNVLPLRALNWYGRILKDNGESTSINLIPTKFSVESRTLKLTISDKAVVTGIQRTNFTNLFALLYRNNYLKLKDESIVEDLEEKYEVLEIENLKIVNKDEIDKPIMEIFNFTSDELIDVVGDKMYFNSFLFNSKITNLFQLEEREYPIDFASPIIEKIIVQIQIPEQFKVVSIPENLAIRLKDDLGVYKYTISIKKKIIQVVSILKLNKGIVPAKYYQEIKEFYKMIVNKNLERVVLKKTKI